MKIVKTVIKLHWKISEKQTDVFLKYLEGIKGAAEYKQAIVAQWGHHSQSGQIADQMYLTDTGVIIDHLKKTKQKCFSVYLNKGPLMSSSILESHIYIHTSGGSMIRSATIIPSCSSMSRKAMTNCAQADIKRGFFVQIFFLLPARMRAMRLVWIKNRSKWIWVFQLDWTKITLLTVICVNNHFPWPGISASAHAKIFNFCLTYNWQCASLWSSAMLCLLLTPYIHMNKQNITLLMHALH